jgi:hypothetical protein
MNDAAISADVKLPREEECARNIENGRHMLMC